MQNCITCTKKYGVQQEGYALLIMDKNGTFYPRNAAAFAGHMCQYEGRFGVHGEQLMVNAVRAGAHEGL